MRPEPCGSLKHFRHILLERHYPQPVAYCRGGLELQSIVRAAIGAVRPHDRWLVRIAERTYVGSAVSTSRTQYDVPTGMTSSLKS